MLCHEIIIIMSFAIYSDRLEVWNCGSFPPGIHGNDIKTLHKSLPPNPKIAKILYYRKMIETWGRGIRLIVQSCLHAGHPEPTFSKDAVGITVTLPSKQPIGPERFTPSDGVSERMLSARQRQILSLIESKEEITLREIKERLVNPPAERTLQDDLARLKSLGLIAGRGRGRGAAWVLSVREVE